MDWRTRSARGTPAAAACMIAMQEQQNPHTVHPCSCRSPSRLEVELGAPEIARLSAARVAMLGTLRRDGSPRISPIEPCIVNGRLLAGVMRWSAKAADLRRDPRYVLHSIVTGPDTGEGELKLHGIAVEAGSGPRGAAAEAWWSAQRPDNAIVYVLRIGQALFVTWDIDRGVMAVHRWSPRDGYSQTTRNYP
jgi:hypothetical protein